MATYLSKTAYGTDYRHYRDEVMSNFAVVLGQDPAALGAIGLPVVQVTKTSDYYEILPAANLMQGGAARLAPGHMSPAIMYETSKDRYQVETWGLRASRSMASVDDLSRDDDHDRRLTQTLTTNFLLSRAQQTAAEIMKLGVWAQEWNNTLRFASQDFDAHSWFADMAEEMLRLSGGSREPNTLIIGRSALRALRKNPTIRALLPKNGSEEQIITVDTIKKVFEGIENVIVIKAVINDANPGAAPDIRFLSSKDALFCYLPRTVGVDPSAATVFELNDPRMPSLNIARFVEPLVHKEHMEITSTFDVKITAPSLGAFVSEAA